MKPENTGELLLGRSNASILITTHENPEHVLLITAANSFMQEKLGWSLPGGGIRRYSTNSKESPRIAAIREALEEAGVPVEKHMDSPIERICLLVPDYSPHRLSISSFTDNQEVQLPEGMERSCRPLVYTESDHIYHVTLKSSFDRVIDEQWRPNGQFIAKLVDVFQLDLKEVGRSHAHVLRHYRETLVSGGTFPAIIDAELEQEISA